MSLARSLIKLLFFHVPRILFWVAGIVRIINRGKRAFEKALKEEDLPEEVVDDLLREFDPLKSFKRGIGFPGWKR